MYLVENFGENKTDIVDIDNEQVCINVKSLTIGYADKLACEAISLEIYHNRVNTIIGPSGCGKSSFIHALSGIISQDKHCQLKGEINFQSKNILSDSTYANTFYKRTGLIFQQPTPFPFSIYKNFSIPLKENGIRNKKNIDSIIQSTLERVGLWEEINDRLHQSALNLSGGQQQRLCIARALALQPEILIMDEPCSALDPIATAHIETLINELKQDYTIVMVTHNLAQARRIADYVSLFWNENNKGVLLEHASAARFFNNPTHPMSQSYIQGLAG